MVGERREPLREQPRLQHEQLARLEVELVQLLESRTGVRCGQGVGWGGWGVSVS